jgi:hypothetical protein
VAPPRYSPSPSTMVCPGLASSTGEMGSGVEVCALPGRPAEGT